MSESSNKQLSLDRTDYVRGLTEEQVREQSEQGLINTYDDPNERTVSQIIRENTFTYFNLIFCILSVLLIVAKSYRSLTFLPIIVANTLIGIIQEIRAKNVLDKMNMVHAPLSVVIRDGIKKQIKSSELVVGDIIVLSAGKQICADAEVISGDVMVNEALITGESDDVHKTIGSRLLSGSSVSSGSCYARLTKVGKDSYISKLTIEAKKMEKGEKSEMIGAINKLVKVIGILVIPMGAALFIQGFVYQKEDFSESVVSMVAAVIGMIPEGLYLLTTIALAVSTMRLARQEVLLHNMKSIETLARVNVLCVDKTGAITDNNMSVCDFITIDKTDENLVDLKMLLGDFVSEMNEDNITMKALKRYFTCASGRKAKEVISFSSKYKYSAVKYEEGTFIIGAPEILLRDNYEEYRSVFEKYGIQGKRVLLFGRYEGDADGKTLSEPVSPLAYIVMENSIRENAAKTFKYFGEQGVKVKVISGDNPVTASAVALKAGIDGAEKYIDATVIKNEKTLHQALETYTVFGRVTPNQKRQIVRELQRMGNTVAMTGDGVNDILALKDADCSIAMASGSEAAAQASQVVLLDSDFSRMPSVVLEGRRVVNNIQRSASLFFVKNIFSFILALLSLAFMFTYPLEPSQISFISMFTIGIPGFFLALEPNTALIKGKFMKNVMRKALPAGITDVIAVCALVFCGQSFKLPDEDISTAATLLLSIVGFIVLYKICYPLNRTRCAVLIGNIVAFVVCALFLNHLFALNAMSLECVLLFVMFSFAAESFLRYLSRFFDWCFTYFDKNKNQ